MGTSTMATQSQDFVLSEARRRHWRVSGGGRTTHFLMRLLSSMGISAEAFFSIELLSSFFKRGASHSATTGSFKTQRHVRCYRARGTADWFFPAPPLPQMPVLRRLTWACASGILE